MDQGPAAVRIEFGEHVVEQEMGAAPRPLGGQTVHRQSQGQGEAALLALGSLDPGVSPAECEFEVVSMGPDRAHGTAQVVGACGGQGDGQWPSQPRR